MSSRRTSGIGVLLAGLAIFVCSCGNRVDVCDRYLERYSGCFSKMGPEAAAAMKDKLARQRDSFRAQAKTAAGRAQLVKECTASLEAISATCR